MAQKWFVMKGSKVLTKQGGFSKFAKRGRAFDKKSETKIHLDARRGSTATRGKVDKKGVITIPVMDAPSDDDI
tara:strand:+ start:489 stop:707 length:219 start_codon:yes stop_codon:yes gene_type:complete